MTRDSIVSNHQLETLLSENIEVENFDSEFYILTNQWKEFSMTIFVMETFRIVPIIATNNIGIDNRARSQPQIKKTFVSLSNTNSSFSKQKWFFKYFGLWIHFGWKSSNQNVFNSCAFICQLTGSRVWIDDFMR